MSSISGWAFGVLEFGESGLFQLSNVIPLTQQQIQTYQLSRNYQQQYHQMVCVSIFVNYFHSIHLLSI